MSKRYDNYKSYSKIGEDNSYKPDDSIITIQDSETIQKFFSLCNQTICVLYVGAKWCGPCKVIGPQFFDLSQKYKEENIWLMKIDGEDPLCREFDISSHISAFPTFLIYNKGRLVDKLVGGPIGKIVSSIEAQKGSR
jgi:thiol-disulfide isomerase/thioredoxin